MAMDLGSGGPLKADINVTPLVDVMLVLLIIMMLVAPMVTDGVPLTLPKANNTDGKPQSQGQTVVAIDASSRLYVNLVQVTAADLVPRVRRALDDSNEKLVYVKGDKDARYAAVMDAMDALRAARIDTIALITDPRADQSGTPVGGRR